MRSSHGFDTAYWVWQRGEPLSETELAELSAQKVQTIYWHVGELENSGETWRWKARFSLPAGNHDLLYVPVVRLVSREEQPFSDPSIAALVAAVTPIAKLSDQLQFDYDAPDRLLNDYARALKKIHATTPRLTITALPHWSRPACLNQLQSSVDEFFPMLYDFAAEPVLKEKGPLPLIEPDRMAKMLEDWSKCGKPWSAGLPVFARLTAYDAAGKSRGQIRNWNWDEICFNSGLRVTGPPQLGASLLRVNQATSVSNTKLQSGDQLVVRWPDRAALREAVAAANKAGAGGVVFFRLPDSSAASGWSVLQIRQLEKKPRLTLRKADEALAVENEGDGDLEPRLAADKMQGGYALEVEADVPIFREAEQGDFAAVAAFADNGNTIKPVAVPFATRLLFKFSHLRAHESLRSGLFQLAPGADFSHAHYRFRNIEERRHGNHSSETDCR